MQTIHLKRCYLLFFVQFFRPKMDNFNLFQMSVIMMIIQGFRIVLELFECHRITGNDVTIFFSIILPKYSGSHLLLSVLRLYGHVFRSTRYYCALRKHEEEEEEMEKNAYHQKASLCVALCVANIYMPMRSVQNKSLSS